MVRADLVITGARVVTPEAVVEADIAIRAGRIDAIGQVGPASETFDATGLIAMPGGVDPHAHIEQVSGMGVMNADTFESASEAAILGGTTSVISFAAQQKGERLKDRVAEYSARAARGSVVDYAFHLSLADTGVTGFDRDLADLIAHGHRSIKVFTTYNIALEDAAIAHVLALARMHGALVCVHAENNGLIAWARDALLKAGLTAPRYHAPSHPRAAEIEAVQRLITFAEFFATPVMLFHISTSEAVEAIRAAKARGAPVWAETCPHYLFMTQAVLEQDRADTAKWMCSPPQRLDADQRALWDALGDGTLSLVSSDHAPYRFDATGKLSAGPGADFSQIANGLPGLQTRLPLMFDALAHEGDEGLQRFAQVTADTPAQIYGLAGKGRLAPGMDADIVLWDPDADHVYGADDLGGHTGYNPWEGRRIRGLPLHVLRRGAWVVKDQTPCANPGSGQWIARTRIGVQATHPPATEVQLIERARQS